MELNQVAQIESQAYSNSLNAKKDETAIIHSQENNLTQAGQLLCSQNLMPQRLSKIKQINTTNQRIQDINRPNIIQQIIHISFPNLTYLNVKNCQITNIQGIQFLNLPVLLALQLYGNNIRSLKSLCKNHLMKKLTTLTIYRNPIKDLWPVQRQYFPNLLYYQLDQKAIATTQDISFLSKSLRLPIRNIYDIFTNRIQQNKVKNKLVRKDEQKVYQQQEEQEGIRIIGII